MPYLELSFPAHVALARVTAAVRESAAPPHPPGAPPRRAPSARAADAVGTLLAGAGVGVPAAWDAVHVYCCKSNLATVYKTLATRGAAAGVAVGPVADCVSVTLTRADEHAALAAAAAAALRAAGWHRLTDTVFINADWAALDGPTAVAVASLGADSELAPPAAARLAIRVSPSRVAPFTPDAALEAAGRLRPGQSAPADARALSDALFGCVAVPLPSLEEATIVGVAPAWPGDGALLAEWRDAVGRPELAPPPVWVQCVPGDDDCDAAAAAAVSGDGLFAPPTCLLLPPVLPSVREGGEGGVVLAPHALGALAAVVDALQDACFGDAFWGGAPAVTGIAERVTDPTAATASAWAPASAGGGAAPADAWRVAPLPAGLATRVRPAQLVVPGPHLAALMEEAAARRLAAEAPPPRVTRAAAAATGATPTAPVLFKRTAVSLVGLRAARPAAAGASKPAARKKVAATAATVAAAAAGSSTTAPKPKRAPKAGPDAATLAATQARVKAAFAEGTQAKLVADDLKVVLKAAGLKVGGKKAELLERVAAMLAAGEK